MYIYDIGDMAIPRETEWTDLQRTLTSMSGHAGGGPVVAAGNGVDGIVAGR